MAKERPVIVLLSEGQRNDCKGAAAIRNDAARKEIVRRQGL
jgi:hypothetical protein